MAGLHQSLLLLLLIFSLAQTNPLQSPITGGHKAWPQSRPYMAALKNSKSYFICGGFLVAPQWVMTSARCEDVHKVVLGAQYLDCPEESQREFFVSSRHPHPEFNSSTFSNDILLLKLHSAVHLNIHIDILQLPESNSDLFDETLCSVAGWCMNERCHPKMVYETYVEIYSQENCQHFYPKIDSGKICAGSFINSQDVVVGEKGDPLVCNGEAHGILSYSNPCPPAVYTRIANYLPWIKKTMAQ